MANTTRETSFSLAGFPVGFYHFQFSCRAIGGPRTIDKLEAVQFEHPDGLSPREVITYEVEGNGGVISLQAGMELYLNVIRVPLKSEQDVLTLTAYNAPVTEDDASSLEIELHAIGYIPLVWG
tara:strand:- start:15147 stop:15515 length:369 start_codon:yes stop_codon:yes gene_type:complete